MSQLSQAEAFNRQYKLESDEKRAEMQNNLIDQALNIGASISSSIINQKASDAFSQLQQDFDDYNRSGRFFEDNDGNPVTSADQVTANFDNWFNEKIASINPLYRDKVSRQWESQRLNNRTSIATKGIEILEARKAQSVDDAFKQIKTTTYQIGDDTIESILAGSDYDSSLWFDSSNTNISEVLKENGLYNQVGFQLLDLGKRMKDLGYKDYQIAETLKANRETLASHNFIIEATNDYMDSFKRGENTEDALLAISYRLRNGIDYFGRGLDDTERASLMKRLENEINITKNAYVSEQNTIYNENVLPAIYSMQDVNGAINKEEAFAIFDDAGFNFNILSTDKKTALNRAFDWNSSVDKVASLIPQYENAKTEEDRASIIASANLSPRELELWGYRYKINDDGTTTIKSPEEFIAGTRAYIGSEPISGEQMNALERERSSVAQINLNDTANKVSDIITDIKLNYEKDGKVTTREELDSMLEGIDINDKNAKPLVAGLYSLINTYENETLNEQDSSDRKLIAESYTNYLLECYSTGQSTSKEGFVEYLEDRMDNPEEYFDTINDYLLTLQQSTNAMESVASEQEAEMQRQLEVDSIYANIFAETSFLFAKDDPEVRMYLTVAQRDATFDAMCEDYHSLNNGDADVDTILNSIAEKYGVNKGNLSSMASEFAEKEVERRIQNSIFIFDKYGKDKPTDSTKTLNDYRSEAELLIIDNMKIANSEYAIVSDINKDYNYQISNNESEIRFKILSGEIKNESELLDALSFDKKRITKDAWDEFTSFIQGDPSTTLKNIGINIEELEKQAYETIGYEKISPMMKLDIRKNLTSYISKNMENLKNGKISDKDIMKSINSSISSVIASEFNEDEYNNFSLYKPEEKTTKKYSSSLADNYESQLEFFGKNTQEVISRRENENYSEQSNFGYINAQDILTKSSDTEELKVFFDGDMSDDERLTYSLSIALKNRGYEFNYNHKDETLKTEQFNSIMRELNRLPKYEAIVVMSTAQELMVYQDQYSYINKEIGDNVVKTRNGKFYIEGKGYVTTEQDLDGNKRIILELNDEESIDITNSKKENVQSVFRKTRSAYGYQFHQGTKRPEPNEDYLQAVINDEEVQNAIKAYELFHPNEKVVIRNIGPYPQMSFVTR